VTRAKALFIVVVLAVSGSIAAQTGAPEVLVGTAEVKNATASLTAVVEVRLRRMTPEFDRKTVETALREGGYPRFVTALRNAPEVGQVVLGGGAPSTIRYARERVDSGNRIIVIVTDQPMYFVGGGRAVSEARKGYEVAVLEIRLDADGAGLGSMAAAARVRPDGDGGVLLDDFAEQPMTLRGIKRKPS
jgi:hypothetical protein